MNVPELTIARVPAWRVGHHPLRRPGVRLRPEVPPTPTGRLPAARDGVCSLLAGGGRA
ncbi:hypothetical protein ACFY2R_02355 [Micromonospora olivasterospora]|uniref:hypothetical protein n=1 Tax=Micromonospora olivasterospora TaxID=1880 RepID=UPI001478CF0D|nr:hypothetical protein [Micromonospora olivasterospora]